MRFQVPQFIEVEDKIFGPLTLKQFIYLVGAGGIIFLLYAFLPFFLTVLFALPVAGFSLALAFYKVNNRPFIKIVESALRFQTQSKLFLWKKTEKPAQGRPAPAEKKEVKPTVYVPRLTEDKLKELSWSLDIKKR